MSNKRNIKEPSKDEKKLGESLLRKEPSKSMKFEDLESQRNHD
jgi:hypothetical protein